MALSSNGTLIDQDNIQQIAEIGYQYIGVSLEGIGKTHDRFRQKAGSFDAAMNGIALYRKHGIKAGVRFTLTQDNGRDFSAILKLVEKHNIDKFYLSHLNYGDRGNRHRNEDAFFSLTRQVMDELFETCLRWEQQGIQKDVVTGNNDADAVYFLHWVRRRFPDQAASMEQRLQQWGGNASGVNVANIDNLGFVHPDTFWQHYSLGNVKERPFSEIWQDVSDPLMAGLKSHPRPLKGRCQFCAYQSICNGNTRVRAQQLFQDPWQEDPGCYLSDEEIA